MELLDRSNTVQHDPLGAYPDHQYQYSLLLRGTGKDYWFDSYFNPTGFNAEKGWNPTIMVAYDRKREGSYCTYSLRNGLEFPLDFEDGITRYAAAALARHVKTYWWQLINKAPLLP